MSVITFTLVPGTYSYRAGFPHETGPIGLFPQSRLNLINSYAPSGGLNAVA